MVATVALVSLMIAQTAPVRVPAEGLVDLDGQRHAPDRWKDDTAIVLFFLGTECPVSNAYVKPMMELEAVVRDKGVRVLGVHADPTIDATAARAHAREYGVTFPILLDPKQKWARPLDVRMVPEVVVTNGAGVVLYQGRIDDRFTSRSTQRQEPTVRDLEAALQAIFAGKLPRERRVAGFGCPLPKAVD